MIAADEDAPQEWHAVADREMRLSYGALADAIEDLQQEWTDDEIQQLRAVTEQAVAAVAAWDVEAFGRAHREASRYVVAADGRRRARYALIGALRPAIETLRAVAASRDLHPLAADAIHWSLAEARDAACEGHAEACAAALARARARLDLEARWSSPSRPDA